VRRFLASPTGWFFLQLAEYAVVVFVVSRALHPTGVAAWALYAAIVLVLVLINFLVLRRYVRSD
jgi:hypothetical protein